MIFNSNVRIKLRDAYTARHEPEAARILAYFFWKILLGLFVTSTTLAVSFGIWEFFNVPHEDTSAVTVQPHVAFSEAELQKALEVFNTRATRFQSRLSSPINIKDPSAP